MLINMVDAAGVAEKCCATMWYVDFCNVNGLAFYDHLGRDMVSTLTNKLGSTTTPGHVRERVLRQHVSERV